MGVKDTFIYEECMKELDATYGAKPQDKRKKMNKMHKCFSTIKSLWIRLRDDMKKEAQTYKEEREQQKRERKVKRGNSQ